MQRRPNRASWHEESAGSPSPLARLLASPQPVRSVHADSSFVGARHNLPGQIGFGPTHQHPVAGTAFTGGRVANPQAGLVHGPSMPSFAEANSHAGHGEGGTIASTLAALGLLAGTPHGGGATQTLPPGPGTQTTATGAAPMPPNMQPLGTGLTYSNAAQDFARAHPETGVIAAPQQEMIHGPGPVSPATLGTLLASLGQKPNPSAGLRGRFLS